MRLCPGGMGVCFFHMAGFDQPEDRLAHEAEELMRQRRFGDAAERYGDLLTRMPTDLWATLGRVSALECAGQLDEARSLLDQLQGSHRRSASFQRFRHLFLVRREDFQAAAASQRALRAEVVEEGLDDQLLISISIKGAITKPAVNSRA